MKIAIIGAGLAGMTTAQQLVQENIEVDVFEKSRGLGGRLATKRLEWAHIDTGAQYFTARNEAFQKQVDQWIEDRVVAPWHFSPYKVIDEELRPSSDNIVRYVGCPGMSSIVGALARGINVHLNTLIVSVDKREEKWQLQSQKGERYLDYDWIITSLPAEQTASLFTTEHESLLNIPASPHLPCWALALATNGSVDAQIQGIFGDKVVSWASRLSSRPPMKDLDNLHHDYNDLWMLHFSPSWSLENHKETDTDIVATGLHWLQNLLQTSLTLKYEHRHYWRYASVKPEANAGICINHDMKIAAIGAWCCGGRVEGAYLSAMELLNNIIYPN
ncbi:NAD(P)/FAD-dependent oxidoreductase [Agarilytica rhodophyticola]|uniref:NAD(P)/FAD-dependent oxidoreductase n=1 Tax=Agarilytica rhodophyticola TaxID=1737490 RepID=UPI000B345221|nr:FAD-dependent oxidoreductase [Agarilytica rhodophyticola]